MPTTLTTLPPEIRNMIWELCVLSPTRELEPVSRSNAYYLKYPKATSSSGPQNYLVISDSKSSVAHDHQHKPTDTQVTGFISTSLLRTCRQIYLETNQMFWCQNAFFFRNPEQYMLSLKSMGQIPARRITCIRLSLGAHHCRTLAVLEKTLRKILSYAPNSSLQGIEIVLTKTILELMVFVRREIFPRLTTSTNQIDSVAARWCQGFQKLLKLLTQENSLKTSLIIPGPPHEIPGGSDSRTEKEHQFREIAEKVLQEFALENGVQAQGIGSLGGKVGMGGAGKSGI